MADYVVEPIKTERPLADIIGDAIAAGLTDDEIRSAVAKRKAKDSAIPSPEAYKSSSRRGDELYQPEPKGFPQAGVIKQGNRVAAPEVKDEGGDVDLGRYGRGPAAAGANMVSGTSFPGAPAANGPAEARGFMRFAAGGLAGMAGGGLAGALGAGPTGQAIAGGAASGALPTAMEGRPAMDVAKDAAIGAAVPTVGGLLTGAGKAVLSSRGAAARRLIEGAGGNVGVKDSGSGLPEFEGKGHISDADIGESARVAGKALLAENDKRFDAEGRQPYKAATAQIDKGQGRNLVDVLPLRRKMIEVAQAPDTDPAVRNVLVSQVAEMDAQFPDTGMGKRFAPESWVNGKTSWLWKQAKPDRLASGAGTPRDAKFADVAAVGQDIREQGPYAQPNAKYAAAKNASGDFREAIGARRAPNVDENIDERRVANALARRGQTTTTAGIQGGDKRLEALLADNPELARIAASPELLRAKADLQFRLSAPHHGGMIDRLAGPGAATAAAGIAALAGHGGIGAAAAIPAYLIGQNATQLQGRVLYNPARAAIPAGQALSGAGQNAPMFGAFQGAVDYKRQHDAAVISTIFGKQPQQGESDNAQEH